MNVRATLARDAIRMAKAQVIVKPLAATQGRDSMDVPRGFWALIKFNGLPRHSATTCKQRRHRSKLKPPASDQQIDNEHDQENSADPDAAAISPPVIAKTAPEDKKKYDNDQDQVHAFSPLIFSEREAEKVLITFISAGEGALSQALSFAVLPGLPFVRESTNRQCSRARSRPERRSLGSRRSAAKRIRPRDDPHQRRPPPPRPLATKLGVLFQPHRPGHFAPDRPLRQ
jgi:hypothetical protein